MPFQCLLPLFLHRRIHLPSVSLTNYGREKPRGLHGFVTGEMFDFDLQILGQQFAQENCSIEEPRSQHPLPKIRRKMTRAFDHPLRVVARHPGARISWSHSLNSLLNIHEAEALALVGRIADTNQYCITEPAQRAAPFHPVRGVENLDRIFVIARAEQGCGSPDARPPKQSLDLAL